MSYGQHSLNFELRIFVNDLLDRLFAADEINCRVDQLFREANVRVAFEQMDVWLHPEKGEAVKVQSASELMPPRRVKPLLQRGGETRGCRRRR